MLWFSLLTTALGIAIDNALKPLATWAGTVSALPERPTWTLAFFALIFAPIVEELTFRAGLRQSIYTLAVGPAVLLLMMASWSAQTGALLGAWIVLVVLVHVWLDKRMFKRPGGRTCFGRRYVRFFPWVFWTYTIVFALMHIANYTVTGPRAAAVLPLLVLPQLLMSVIAGYMRLRDGLKSSASMHFILNVFGLIVLELGYG